MKEVSVFITVRRSELIGLRAELAHQERKAERDSLGFPNELQDTFASLVERVDRLIKRERKPPVARARKTTR